MPKNKVTSVEIGKIVSSIEESLKSLEGKRAGGELSVEEYTLAEFRFEMEKVIKRGNELKRMIN